MWAPNEIVDNTYMIVQELGRGGTGVIYLAYHLRLEKYVVLKRIMDRFTNLLRVRTEVDILKKLHHPYLPQVYDFMQVQGQIYTVIDYIDGCDLEQYLQSSYVFTEEQLVLWLRQMCEVLEYLHNQKPQILHCDIKPGNIMITSQGNVCLIDFNISLDEDSPEELAGISQYYASPEQYEKAAGVLYGTPTRVRIDRRTDIYSLGATFYHMICGRYPLGGQENYPLSQMGLGYSPDLLRIVDKMMAFHSSLRYHTTREILKDLDGSFSKNRAFRRLVLGITAASILYVGAMATGWHLHSQGKQLLLSERYQAEYGAFEDSYQAGEYALALDRGIDLLNNAQYRELLKNGSREKAAFLHYLGECCFYREDYVQASRFYKEAMDSGDYSREEAKFCRDYAVCLVRQNQISQARDLMRFAEENGLKQEDLQLIEAEIHRMEGKDSMALQTASGLVGAQDPQLRRRALLLLSEVSSKLGDASSQVRYLQDLVEMDASLVNYRRLGDAWVEVSQQSQDAFGNEQKRALEQAIECYEVIRRDPFCTYRDRMNLAVCCLQTDQYERALTVLDEVRDEDVSYTVQMYRAFAYEKLKRYDSARDYCILAIRLYESTPPAEKLPSTDPTIRRLYALEQMLR